MTFSYELGRPSLHFVKNHPAKFPHPGNPDFGRDWTGDDFAGLIFLSSSAVAGIVVVLLLGHDPALERGAQTAPAAAV
jgi:hypothetical protein